MSPDRALTLFETDELASLRHRIADLEGSLTATRAAEQAERDRREAAELSRDQWATVAGTRDAATLRADCDPLLAVDQAYAATRRTEHRLTEAEAQLRTERVRRDGLAQIVWALKQLPVPPKRLHPDAVRALAWLLSEHGRWEAGMSGVAPALPPAAIAEVQHIAAGWRELEIRSLAGLPLEASDVA